MFCKKKLSLGFCVFTLSAALNGCAPDQVSNPGFSPQTSYVTPKDLTTQTSATLVGSKDSTANPLSTDATIYLVSIDGNPVGFGWRDWNDAVLVKPGEHYIEFAECVCGLFVSPWGGNVDVEVNVKAGQTYTLKANPPFQAYVFAPVSSDGWVEDENGSIVSNVVGDNGILVEKKSHFALGPQSVPLSLR